MQQVLLVLLDARLAEDLHRHLLPVRQPGRLVHLRKRALPQLMLQPVHLTQLVQNAALFQLLVPEQQLVLVLRAQKE